MGYCDTQMSITVGVEVEILDGKASMTENPVGIKEKGSMAVAELVVEVAAKTEADVVKGAPTVAASTLVLVVVVMALKTDTVLLVDWKSI